MKKDLGEAPLPIGGWLILPAVSLLNILYNACNYFIMVILNIPTIISSPNGYYYITYISTAVFSIIALPLSIYCTVLFFRRRRNFFHTFVVLQIIFILYEIAENLSYGLQIYGFSEVFNYLGFYNYFKMSFYFVFGLAIIIYLYRSQRAKHTFLVKKKEIISNEQPLQINGWLVLVAVSTAVFLNQSFFNFAGSLPSIFYPNNEVQIIYLLLYFIEFAFCALTVILLFNRKKLFKWFFSIIAIASAIVYVDGFINSLNYLDEHNQSFFSDTAWFLYIPRIIFNLYPIAFIVYMFVSRRAKNTFVYPTFISSNGITPSADKTPQYWLPVEISFTDDLKQQLDDAMLACKAQPIGSGYVDIVTAKEYILPFIEAMQKLNIRIRAISWWCFNQGEPGCPHGAEPRKSRYFDGSFSEMLIPVKEFKKGSDYNDIIKYLQEDFPKSKKYLPCLVPGFWLDVPEGWRFTL